MKAQYAADNRSFSEGGYSDEQAYAIGFANMHHESFINGMRVEYAMEQYGNAHGGASAFSIFLRKKAFYIIDLHRIQQLADIKRNGKGSFWICLAYHSIEVSLCRFYRFRSFYRIFPRI